MNGADRLCDTLLVNDVDVCFANPGTSEMHFVAALDRENTLPMDTMAYKFDIVLRGRRSTLFENRMEGN